MINQTNHSLKVVLYGLLSLGYGMAVAAIASEWRLFQLWHWTVIGCAMFIGAWILIAATKILASPERSINCDKPRSTESSSSGNDTDG